MDIQTEAAIDIVKQVKTMFADRERSAQIHEKGVADFVTQVDFGVQEYVERELRIHYPQIQFMGEEKDNSEIDFSKDVWILDPVDGTTNLIHDFRASTLSLALCRNRELVFGVIYQPYTEELFWAEKGKGAWLNGEPIHVSERSEMKDSLIAIGTAPYHKAMAQENFRLFEHIFMDCADIRRLGSAALELAYVACGRTEAYFERSLNPWDYAAGVLLVQEAGGTVTDFAGNEIDVTKAASIVGSNGKIGTILTKEYL